MKIISPLLLLLFFGACTQAPVTPSASGLLILDLDEAVSSETIPLSTIATAVEYVPLETNDSCRLTGFRKFFVSDDYIFVCSDNIPLVFGRNGKFLTRLAYPPGWAYKSVSHLHYNAADRIVTLFLFGRGVLRFDVSGRFLSADTLQRIPGAWNFHQIGGNDRYALTWLFHPDTSRVFIEDRTLGTVTPVRGRYNAYVHIDPEKHQISSIANTMCYYQNYLAYYDIVDQLYYRLYYDGRIENPYYFKYAGMSDGGKDPMSGLCETSRYLFLSTYNPFYQYVYDKKTGRLSGTTSCIEDDLAHGPELRINGLVSDGRLFGVFDVAYFKERAALYPGADARAVAGRLNDDDNPVLVLVTLKK